MTHDVTSFSGRLLAHLDMLFVDHGIFREVYNNLHALPGGLYRISQPSPRQIRKYHRKYGIKTMINLRGADDSRRYALEEHTCRELGITLVNHKGILSRSAPTVEAIESTGKLFESIEYPAMIHCKSGADRAGFACALYRILHLNESVQESKRELAWYYGHFDASKTGILDYFLDMYVTYNAKQSVNFMTWTRSIYDRKKMSDSFQPKGWANFIVDNVLHRE